VSQKCALMLAALTTDFHRSVS